MNRLWRASSERPALVLGFVAALTLLALAGIVDPLTGAARLTIDPSFEKLLAENDPGRDHQAAQSRRFGTSESVVVALEPQGGALSLSGIELVGRVEERLLDFREIARITSIASTVHIEPGAGEIGAVPLLERVRANPASLPSLRAAALADPQRAGILVSPDGRLAALHVDLEPMSEQELVESNLDRRIETAVRRLAPDAEVWVAGAPFFKAEMSRILNGELATQVPLVLAIMLVFAGLAFRSSTHAWLPVATILLALVWTLGAMGWSGHALNLVTSIVPPLILVVGFAYAIHVVAETQAVSRTQPSVARALEKVAGPVILTGLTTAGAFLSLHVSAHEAIRQFGDYGAFGVAAALVASLTFTPAVLSLVKPRFPQRLEARERRLDRLFRKLAGFDLRHRTLLLTAACAVLAGSLVAATWIEVDTRTVENFHADSMIRRGYERLNEALDGADVFYVMIDGPERGSLLEPARLREIDRLQTWLDAQPEIGGTTSVVDRLRAGQRALGGISPLDPAATRSLVAQLLWLADGDAIDSLLDARRQTTLVQVRSRATSSREIAALVSRIEAHVASLGESLSASVTGGTVLLARAVDDVSRDQARSMGLAFAIILGILAVAFRSLRLAFLALLPNVLPVAAYFGALGATGIPLNNATALLGCVVLGIAIDDTLHLVVRHRSHALRGEAPEQAASAALADVGRPVTWTTMALCLGLLVLTTSELVTQAQFGALGAATLLFAWAVDLTVTPALCSLLTWKQPATAASEATAALSRPTASSG